MAAGISLQILGTVAEGTPTTKSVVTVGTSSSCWLDERSQQFKLVNMIF